MTTIAVLDYGIGNIKSICSALEKIGSGVVLTNEREPIFNADGLVIPGVGAFAHGMDKLAQLDLISLVQDYSLTGKPILGICLGMQMLFSGSTEFGNTKGLNLIEGCVNRLANVRESIKLPHVSWNGLIKNNTWEGTILDSLPSINYMYFVHSFVATPTDKNHILSSTCYAGIDFCSTVKKGNIYGCQFHPEKSAEQGLKIVQNFSKICQETR